MSTPANEPHNPYSQGGPSYDGASFDQPPRFHGHTPKGDPLPGSDTPQRQDQGAQLTQTAMVLGILSVVLSFLGFIFGPIAIAQARRAERDFHTPATVGRVTGWIGSTLGLLWLFAGGFALFALFFFAPAGG